MPDNLHQVIDTHARLFDHPDTGVDHLGQVVWRDIGRHPHRNPGRTVDQQVRNLGRQHLRLVLRLIVVRGEVDRFLVDVGQQLVRNLGHAHFGVTHRSRRITVYRTEVALAVDQHVAQREGLGHAHDGVVDGGVAMRVVFTDDVANHTRRLLVRLVPIVAQLAHGEQHTTVHRLQAVTHIRQRTPDDDAHRVVQVGLLHLVFEIDGDNFLGELGHIRLS